LLEFLSGIGRQTLIVATKSDRQSGNQLRNVLQAMAREYPHAQVIPYSAKTGDGREELWRQIRGGVQTHSRASIVGSVPFEEPADLP
jgi:selenocysteine-specific translation elongation factor